MMDKAWVKYWDDPEDGERRYRITAAGVDAISGWVTFKLQQDEMLNEYWDDDTDLDVQMAFLIALIIPTVRELVTMVEQEYEERETE